jgi:hypothetical protein
MYLFLNFLSKVQDKAHLFSATAEVFIPVLPCQGHNGCLDLIATMKKSY